MTRSEDIPIGKEKIERAAERAKDELLWDDSIESLQTEITLQIWANGGTSQDTTDEDML